MYQTKRYTPTTLSSSTSLNEAINSKQKVCTDIHLPNNFTEKCTKHRTSQWALTILHMFDFGKVFADKILNKGVSYSANKSINNRTTCMYKMVNKLFTALI